LEFTKIDYTPAEPFRDLMYRPVNLAEETLKICETFRVSRIHRSDHLFFDHFQRPAMP
jgi:hypothetical protein